ncbi:MAG: hypothetical protein P8183_20690 [Anaerolineae bacterium]
MSTLVSLFEASQIQLGQDGALGNVGRQEAVKPAHFQPVGQDNDDIPRRFFDPVFVNRRQVVEGVAGVQAVFVDHFGADALGDEHGR